MRGAQFAHLFSTHAVICTEIETKIHRQIYSDNPRHFYLLQIQGDGHSAVLHHVHCPETVFGKSGERCTTQIESWGH